jgi:hypothetical protein
MKGLVLFLSVWGLAACEFNSQKMDADYGAAALPKLNGAYYADAVNYSVPEYRKMIAFETVEQFSYSYNASTGGFDKKHTATEFHIHFLEKESSYVLRDIKDMLIKYDDAEKIQQGSYFHFDGRKLSYIEEIQGTPSLQSEGGSVNIDFAVLPDGLRADKTIYKENSHEVLVREQDDYKKF